MTLFGTTLDAGQITALVGLLATLVLWFIVLGREQGYARWFRQWEAEGKTRRDAELGQTAPPPGDGPRKGPWG